LLVVVLRVAIEYRSELPSALFFRLPFALLTLQLLHPDALKPVRFLGRLLSSLSFFNNLSLGLLLRHFIFLSELLLLLKLDLSVVFLVSSLVLDLVSDHGSQSLVAWLVKRQIASDEHLVRPLVLVGSHGATIVDRAESGLAHGAVVLSARINRHALVHDEAAVENGPSVVVETLLSNVERWHGYFLLLFFVAVGGRDGPFSLLSSWALAVFLEIRFKLAVQQDAFLAFDCVLGHLSLLLRFREGSRVLSPLGEEAQSLAN